MAVDPIPKDTSTVTPYLVVADAARLIDFLKQAFDAREIHRTTMPDGTVMHAQVRIGNSSVMMGQMPRDKVPPPAMLYMYVMDVDATFARAVQAGAKPAIQPMDQFYGDRAGMVEDFAGNKWWIATHKEDVPDAELARRAAEARAPK